MKTLINRAGFLLLALHNALAAAAVFLLVPLKVWYERTWCFWDVKPDELARALAAATGEVKDFIQRQDGLTKELRVRVLELEQKGARRPPDSGDGGAAAGQQILDRLHKHADWDRIAHGSTPGKLMIELEPGVINTKAIIVGDSGTRPLVAPDRALEIVAPAERRLTVSGLLPHVPTTSNMTEFTQEATFTNRAEPQGSGVSPTASEGEMKAESDMTFVLVQSPIITIAHAFTVSRQALEDAPALQQHLEARGLYGLALEVEDELLNGTGAVGDLNGLINNATAFNRGATGDTPYDVIRKAITELALSDHVATGVILNPADWEAIELAKDSVGQYLNIVLNVNGRTVAWRIDVVPTNSIAKGRFLCGDFPAAGRIRDRQQAFVAISTEHADYFRRNLALVLIETRLGLEIHRSNALVYGDLAVGG